jgi:hypothetical protein
VHLIAGRLGIRFGTARADRGVATSLVGIRGAGAAGNDAMQIVVVPEAVPLQLFEGTDSGRTRQVERSAVGLSRQSRFALLLARTGTASARSFSGCQAFPRLSQLVSTLEIAVNSEVEGEKVGEEGSQLSSRRWSVAAPP